MDFMNAFNLISRDAVRDAVRRMAPSLSNAFAAAYDVANPNLFFGEETITSRTGIHQGSAESGTYFAMGADKFVRDLAAAHPNLDLHAWYFDDNNVVGTMDEVRAVLDWVIANGRQYGLVLNLDKCMVGHPLREELAGEYRARLAGLFPEIAVYGCEGVEVLGTWVGRPDGVAAFWRKKLVDVAFAHKHLGLMEDAQVAHQLQIYCLTFGKVNHLMRSTPGLPVELLREFDTLQRQFIDRCMSISVSDSHWKFISLPIRNAGGCGQLRTEEVAPLAFLASYLETAPQVEALIRQSIDSNAQAIDLPALYPDDTIAVYTGRRSLTDLLHPPNPLKKLQHEFSHAYFDARATVLTNQLVGPEKLHRDSVSTSEASAFLTALLHPSTPWTRFSSADFRLLYCLRIRYALFPLLSQCCVCNGSMDIFGYHALSCKRGDQNGYWRHNLVSHAAVLLARFARLDVIDKNLPSFQGSLPDFIVKNFHDGKQAVCDTKVYNPMSPSNIVAAMREGRAGYLQMRQVDVEVDPLKGVRFSAAPNSVFYAFVFDVFGNTSLRAKEFINQLATHHARVSGYEWSQTTLFVRNKLVLAGVKGTVAMLRVRYLDSPFDNEFAGQAMGDDAGG
jgi:hypothetical protein